MTEGNSETILVVDDDPVVCKLTVMMLEDMGYHVIEAGGGQEALDLLENDPSVDLLLTDAMMPGISGMELARVAKQRWPSIKVVYCSGSHEAVFDDGDPEDVRHPVLGKPFLESALAEMVRTVLDS